MTPRNTIFTREKVILAALDILRDRGMAAVTARNVARQLGSSVAPVYSTFDSICDLQREVLERASRMMDANTRKDFTPNLFLNIGVGIVVFAREEPQSFRALFLHHHRHRDILEKFFQSKLDRMKTDPMLQLMSEKSLDRLLQNVWLYTLGLATSVIYDQLRDTSTENIIASLNSMGGMLIYSELSGIIEPEHPDHQKYWKKLLEEKNISWPVSDECSSHHSNNKKGVKK